MIISKDTKKAYQQIAGLFILYIFSTANDISKESKRQKVMSDDIYKALNEMGFDKYTTELKEFMRNYNAEKEEKKHQIQAQKRALETNDNDDEVDLNKKLKD